MKATIVRKPLAKDTFFKVTAHYSKDRKAILVSLAVIKESTSESGVIWESNSPMNNQAFYLPRLNRYSDKQFNEQIAQVLTRYNAGEFQHLEDKVIADNKVSWI